MTKRTQHPTFDELAAAKLKQHYSDQVRIAALEITMAECLHYIEGTWGPEDDLPEPECALAGKRLLGWALA